MDGRLNQLVRRMFRGSSAERRSGGQLQREEVEETGGTMRSGGGVVTFLELDVLDCPVCWQPLCPPVFQCAVGHLICSSCLAKLPNKKKCYTCFRKDKYNRCYSMEKVLASMQVPCSNARYGCTVKTSYHQKQDHEATCPYELCFCPGRDCGFSGRSALHRHFTDHGWPSTTFSYGASLDVAVKDEELRVLVGDDGHLFLLTVTLKLKPSSCIVFSVVCVRPRDAEPKFRCFMYFGSSKNGSRTESEFQVPSTTFSDGMGMPRDSVMFSVPKFYLEKDSKISVIMHKTLA